MCKIKDFISQAYEIEKLIKAKLHEIEHLRQLSKCVSASRFYELVDGGNKKNKIEELVIKIISYENSLNDDIDKLIDCKIKIKKFIENINNKELVAILTLKYLSFKTFAEISDHLKYSERQIYRLHKSALDELNNYIHLLE